MTDVFKENLRNNLYVLTKDWIEGFSTGDVILRGESVTGHGYEYFNMNFEIGVNYNTGISYYYEGDVSDFMDTASESDCERVFTYFSSITK